MKNLNLNLLVVLALFLFNCESQSSSNKDELIDLLDSKQQELNDQLYRLKKESKQLSGDALKDIKHAISKIDAEKDKIDSILKKVKKSSDKEFEQLKTELESSLDDSLDQIEKWIKSAQKDLK